MAPDKGFLKINNRTYISYITIKVIPNARSNTVTHKYSGHIYVSKCLPVYPVLSPLSLKRHMGKKTDQNEFNRDNRNSF